MARIITIDLDKLQAARGKLKARKPTESEISRDLAAYLASLAIQLDEQTASMLRSRLAARGGGAQSAPLHIDI